MGEEVTVNYILRKYKCNGDNTKLPIQLNCLRTDFPQLFNELDFKIGVEVGTRHGIYADILLSGSSNLKLFCVDPYIVYNENIIKSQNDLDIIENEARNRLSKYKNRVTIIKKTSMDAVKDFKNNSIDFVYIDGNHEFQHVVNDIYEWQRRVKTGGIVAGHDFDRHKLPSLIHVKDVVTGYTDALNIKPWFITKRLKDGTLSGNCAISFLWVKRERE